MKPINVKDYEKIHYWLKVIYGKAIRCENKKCVGKSNQYQWAKLKDKKYDFKRDNFIQLCRSCHAKYDCTEKTREKLKKINSKNKTHCKYGHKFTKKNTYIQMTLRTDDDYKGVKSCKKCRRQNYINYETKNNEQKVY